jgi:hypothetical protein
MMKEEDRKKIEELMGEMSCPHNFKCAESGFERLCKSKDVGLEEFLVCLEDDAWLCKFAVPFGNAHFCQCPIRVYLAKKLKI